MTKPFIPERKHFIVFNNVGARHRGQRKYGTSKRPLIMQPVTGAQERTKTAPPKKELQKSTPKIAKEFIDTRWPKVDNISRSLLFKSRVCTVCRICLTTCLDSGECNARKMISK